MKDNRERVGDATEHKLQNHIVISKPKRLTLPFGATAASAAAVNGNVGSKKRADEEEAPYEHHIREIPLAGGGLGCALWDGGLVLARWVFAHGSIFAGKTVLELGCGVGLAGIMAAHWAQHVTLTDYIDDTVRNAMYNVKINSADEDDEEDDDSTSPIPLQSSPPRSRRNSGMVSGALYSRDILNHCSGRLLDWDAELRSASEEGNSDAPPPPPTTMGEDKNGCCTAVTDHLGHRSTIKQMQPWYRCVTCWPKDTSSGVCAVCANKCHATHELELQPAERFLCDCGKSDVVCTAVPPQPPITPVDIMIGSELTYNLLSCKSLAYVVNKYLVHPNGVFYEVLSDDRDGVAVFIEEIEALGFETVKRPAPAELVGNFGTRKWSKQDVETYSLYTWRRADCPEELKMPIME